MGKRVQNVFSATNIDFKVRPYAMGGTSSGPEIAACAASVFGRDIDVLSWDTGMCDGYAYDLMGYYFLHAYLSIPTRPLAVGLHTGVREQRLEAMADLQNIGLPLVWHNESWYKYMENQLPDTADGKTLEEIQQMPEFVRYFKCGRTIETGDLCEPQKYNTTTCDDRKYKASWHPGFKWHAMEGNVYALFMADVLADALGLLIAHQSDLPALRDEIVAREQATYEKIASNSKWPGWLDDLVRERIDVSESPFNVTQLVRANNLCHTARLPSEIRYRGILTENPNRTGFDYDYDRAHRDGFPMDPEEVANTTQMSLVISQGDRQDCKELLNIDYKDYFVAGVGNVWHEITLPNDSEIQEYGLQDLEGIIAICFRVCDWGQCPDAVYRYEAIDGREADEQRNWKAVEPGQGALEVNGVAVNHTSAWYKDCRFLHHANGTKFEANANGKWTIRARMMAEGKMFQFSSFLIW